MRKKHFLEHGKKISNGFKFIFSLFIMTFNIVHFITNKTIISIEHQKSLVIAVIACYLILSPIDLCIIVLNILKIKYGKKDDECAK